KDLLRLSWHFHVAPLSGLDRFENGVEVERIAEFHELLAQMRDVNAAWHVDDHLHREHGRAGMRGGVAAGRDLGDVDPARGEETRQPGDDAALIETYHVDRIRQHVGARRTRLGALEVNAEVARLGETLELGFQLRQRVPVARHQQQHGEFRAEVRHAAFADVAARLADYAGQLMNHARAVAADRRNGQVLLHLWVAGVLL